MDDSPHLLPRTKKCISSSGSLLHEPKGRTTTGARPVAATDGSILALIVAMAVLCLLIAFVCDSRQKNMKSSSSPKLPISIAAAGSQDSSSWSFYGGAPGAPARLLQVCNADRDRILVCELLERGSLDAWLHGDDVSGPPLIYNPCYGSNLQTIYENAYM
ncbi:hypothetical protein EJB05_54326, partial [Eragrostis curvula]